MSEPATLSIVDDDELVRKALCRLVCSAGYQVEAYASAEEFLGSGGQHRLQCLILDLKMPGISGLELQHFLQSEGYHQPIIIITGHFDEMTRILAMQAGAIDVLGKPFGEDRLLEAIGRALAV